MNDLLTIGYDSTDGIDRSCLVVSRKDLQTSTSEILNCFYNEQADEMYEQLISVHGRHANAEMIKEWSE